MAEMEDLHQTLLLVDLIVDDNRAVDQLAHSRSFAHSVPHPGEPAEQIDVIEQCPAKTGSGIVVILGDMPHDLGQMA
jgi:hypothetical protein